MSDPQHQLQRRFYPEVDAGGFSRLDSTIEFYQRINALIRPEMTVCDFGAGRGQFLDGRPTYRQSLQLLRGKVERVVGLDVDPAVLSNKAVDRALVITQGEPLALETGSIDMIVSDWTFEHVGDAGWLASEFTRVLKPGGWICARTPNKWGYIGVGARAIPNRLHASFLEKLQPVKKVEDTFPTAYNMNTLSAIRELFPSAEFGNYSYRLNAEPSYAGTSRSAWRLSIVLNRLTPATLAPVLLVFLQKHPV